MATIRKAAKQKSFLAISRKAITNWQLRNVLPELNINGDFLQVPDYQEATESYEDVVLKIQQFGRAFRNRKSTQIVINFCRSSACPL